MLGQLYGAGEGVETQADINWCKQDNLNTKLETAGQYQTSCQWFTSMLWCKNGLTLWWLENYSNLICI